jgi:CheY-like chemotaxis protein
MNDSFDHKAAGEPGSHTVMVVEPDILARVVIADYLRSCGYKIIEAVNADDVFTVLRAGGLVQTIFTEVTLPGDMDGFTLAKTVREQHPDVDVILTSSIASAAQKASNLCDDGPLDKPYHPQEVMRRINLLRERRRLPIPPK